MGIICSTSETDTVSKAQRSTVKDEAWNPDKMRQLGQIFTCPFLGLYVCEHYIIIQCFSLNQLYFQYKWNFEDNSM